VLLGGVPGVPAAKVVILGGGVSGTNAARMAMGVEAHVIVIDKSLQRLYDLDLQFGSRLHTRFSTRDAIEREVLSADLVIGAVLVPGAAAPKLVTADMVKRMKRGSVLVDISIDQGGCFETSRPTTHDNPDLRGRRDRALLRRQHAGRGRAHLDLRAQQRHPALRDRARRQGRQGGDARRPASAQRPQRASRQDHARGGRRGLVARVPARRPRARGLRESAMHLLITIVSGLVIGIIARFLLPGRDPMGFIITTVVGIAGALLAKYVGESLNWYAPERQSGSSSPRCSAPMALLLVLRALRGKL
jgi:uncharacterized membrane protein YeaQ/YmgE (transglycosylase-associated protein family)